MNATTVARALGAGTASGLRTMSGPATAKTKKSARWLLRSLALAEFVVDKLPNIPRRTLPPALAARIIAGGIAATLVVENEADWCMAGLLGALAAAGAAYAGAAIRDVAAEHMPPIVAALFEDAVAVGIGSLAARGIRR